MIWPLIRRPGDSSPADTSPPAPEPALSVIIPARNEAERILPVLQHIHRHADPVPIEVIVVDGTSRDNTRQLASPLAQVLISKPGRARQLNRGARAARAEVLLFCHADSLLPAEYALRILLALRDPGAVGGAFRPRYPLSHPALRMAELVLRPASSFLMFGDQALFARRSALETIGFYPDLPLFEDVGLARQLARLGRLVRLPVPVVTSARRFLERGVLRQLLLDTALLLSYHLGAPVSRLAPLYFNTARDRPGQP